MRTKLQTADLIVPEGVPPLIACADLHLMDSVPVSRLETKEQFLMSQFDKLDYLFSYAGQVKIRRVVIAGDLFDSWDPSHRIVSWLARMITRTNTEVYAAAGQHDLPTHRMDLIDHSAIGVLAACGLIKIKMASPDIRTMSWGQSIPEAGRAKVLVAHVGISAPNEKAPWAVCSAVDFLTLAEKQGYRVVITGDNHKTFTITSKKGSLLINPGSMLRLSADQIDHQPVFFDLIGGRPLKMIKFPTRKGVVTREHVESVATRDERIQAFVSKLKTVKSLTLDFRQNLIRHLTEYKIEPELQRRVLLALEEMK